MNGEQAKEIAIETAGLPTPLEVELDSQKAIARISSIAQVIDGCVKVSIQRTNPQDWVRNSRFDRASGKRLESFYLQASGAQKIRPIWGIYYRDRHVTKEVNPDGTYSFIVTGSIGSKVLDQLYGEVVIEIDGGRSSNDAFFTGRDGMREPDSMDVRKASLANWEARAVTALLGLKNLTAADLTRNNIKVEDIPGVEYKGGAEGGGQTELISEPQRKRLFAICKSSHVAETFIKDHLQKTYKIDSTSKILRKDYDAICEWAQKGGVEDIQIGREPGSEG